MSSSVESHVLGRLAAARIERDPFAHCVIDGIFPEPFFEEICDRWPPRTCFESLSATGRVTKGSYAERLVVRFTDDDFSRLPPALRVFWAREVGDWLFGERFIRALLDKFAAELAARLAGTSGPFHSDALLVSDQTSYAIGPHTDAPHRLVSLLFYLPEDTTFRRFGTSFYVPKDPAFRCSGGPHYDGRDFTRVSTVEFVPNRLVVFPKSDTCFHGVERVDLPGIDRRLLIHNLRAALARAAPAQPVT